MLHSELELKERFLLIFENRILTPSDCKLLGTAFLSLRILSNPILLLTVVQ